MSSPHSSAVVSASGVNASSSPGMTGSVARDRTLPDILTYRFSSEMVYVTLGETYEQAVDFAAEAFPALRDVDRDLICLEVSVVTRGSNSSEPKTVRIGKRAWPVVVAALKRFEIVEIRVASTPQASSSVAEPPPYAGSPSAKEQQYLDLAPSTPQVSTSQLRRRSLAERVVNLFTCKSSRDSQSP